MKLRGLFIFLGFLTAAFGGEQPTDLQIFLLLGQSNMAGRGAVEPLDKTTHPRIFAFTSANVWAPAMEPLHWDKPAIVGVGPGFSFARAVAEADEKIRIGLVPLAVGGSSLDQWKPGGAFYTDALSKAKIALRSGKLAAILWHQGESDSAPEKASTYAARFSVFVRQLRLDLDAAEVPIIIGEVGRFPKNGEAINPVLDTLPQLVPNCFLVTSEGLTDKGDGLHFDTPSARKLGQRYAQAWRVWLESKQK